MPKSDIKTLYHKAEKLYSTTTAKTTKPICPISYKTAITHILFPTLLHQSTISKSLAMSSFSLPSLLILLLLAVSTRAALPPCTLSTPCPANPSAAAPPSTRANAPSIVTRAAAHIAPASVRARRGGSRGGSLLSGAAAGAAAGAIVSRGRRGGRRLPLLEEEEDDDDDDDEDDSCFPSSALVTERHRGLVPISTLSVGDSVLTHVGYSEIHAFSHKDGAVLSRFVRLAFGKGRLDVSPGHYVYARGGLITAREVKVGDVLQTVAGEKYVDRIEWVDDVGLFNPQTLEGEMIVNGVRVSCYTSAVEVFTANAALAPFRAAYRAFGIDFIGGGLRLGGKGVAWGRGLLPRGGSIVADVA